MISPSARGDVEKPQSFDRGAELSVPDHREPLSASCYNDAVRRLADLDFRDNAIGFLRLLFAAAVVWSHAYILGGFGRDPIERLTQNRVGAGYLAVAGFFVLSGFLITRSFERVDSAGRFLWHRFLRIFPGFWSCLLISALVLAPLAYMRESGSLEGFFTTQKPWSYIISNAALVMRHYNIGSLLASNPYPLAFDGSLWTLAYEFACYIGIAILGATAIIRRKPEYIVAMTLMLLSIYATLFWRLAGTHAMGPIDAIGLLAYFSLGATAYLYRQYITLSVMGSALCFVAILISLATPAHALIAAPCLAYIVLFAADQLPVRSFDRNMDLSYGVYIYAFPIQQLLTLFGLNGLGFNPYLALTISASASLAAFSWFVVEKPSLSLKTAKLRARLWRRDALL